MPNYRTDVWDEAKAVRAKRALIKKLCALLGAVGSLYVLWAVSHGSSDYASAYLAGFVFIPFMWAARAEHEKVLGFLNLKKASWGFLAMGSLLAWAASLEAGVWQSLRSPHWLDWLTGPLGIPRDWPQTWGWLVVGGLFVLGYAVIFRKGEAKQYDDDLRFNSIKKITGDFVSTPVGFGAVVCGVVVAMCTDWPALLRTTPWYDLPLFTTPGLIAVLIVAWALLGQLDLLRLKGQLFWAITRADLHVQGTPRGPAYDPPLQGVPSPTEFDEHYRDELRDERNKRGG